MPGLCLGNNYIAADEALHFKFAINYYHNYCKNKLDSSKLKEIILECFETEILFVDEIIPANIKGLNKESVKEYIKYVTDTILINYGLKPLFFAKQPFSFMEKIAIQRKNNFFETRSNEYSSPKNSEIIINKNLDF